MHWGLAKLSLQSGNLNALMVYMSTDMDNLNKLHTEFPKVPIKFDQYGLGTIYWSELVKNTIIGVKTPDTDRKIGSKDTAPKDVQQHLISTSISFNDSRSKHRLNRLNVEWTFETIDESKELKQFMNSTKIHLLRRIELNAFTAFHEKYDVDIKLPEGDITQDKYNEYLNRCVTCFEVLGTTEDDKCQLYYVQWFDYNSLKYIEENPDKFILMNELQLAQKG